MPKNEKPVDVGHLDKVHALLQEAAGGMAGHYPVADCYVKVVNAMDMLKIVISNANSR